MRSRKILFLGAGALILVVAVVVLLTRGGPSLHIVRGGGTAFPLRGSLADDQGTIDDALDAWKDGRGADSKAARVDDDLNVQLLYAGRVDHLSVVIVRQGGRLIAMHQPRDRTWVVGEAQDDNFTSFDRSPVTIDGAVLLPDGDWTYLPLRAHTRQPQIVDGLVSSGYAGDNVDPGFFVEGGTGAGRKYASNVYDTEAGLFRVDPQSLVRIRDASRHPGRLLAIHAALVGDDAEPATKKPTRLVDVLWTGRVPGVREAAVVARDDPHRLGLGLVRDPDGLVSSAQSVNLGSRTNPLGAHRRVFYDEPYVGAAYVGAPEQPTTLVAAATRPVNRIELLIGTRRSSHPSPVVVVPVDWDTATTDALVLGRTARGAVIAPLVPESP